MALEWILAKVGRRLAETPAEDGLGSFLTLEDRPLPPPPATAAAAAAAGGGDGGVGAWGGEELWVVPAAVCDVALRENVATELEARRGSGSGGGVAVALEDLRADPTEAFPWERSPAGLESPAAATGTTTAGGCSGGVEDGQRSTAAEQDREGGRGQGSGCDRGMVFGDAGEWGSEQTAMFQVREGGQEAGGRGDGGDGGGGGGGGQNQADIAQVGVRGVKRAGAGGLCTGGCVVQERASLFLRPRESGVKKDLRRVCLAAHGQVGMPALFFPITVVLGHAVFFFSLVGVCCFRCRVASTSLPPSPARAGCTRGAWTRATVG